MQRITDAMLERLADRLNRHFNAPTTPYTKTPEGLRANIGSFYVSYQNGGVCMHRMENESGGVSCPVIGYHCTKRELYDAVHAFLRGVDFADENRPAV